MISSKPCYQHVRYLYCVVQTLFSNGSEGTCAYSVLNILDVNSLSHIILHVPKIKEKYYLQPQHGQYLLNILNKERLHFIKFV